MRYQCCVLSHLIKMEIKLLETWRVANRSATERIARCVDTVLLGLSDELRDYIGIKTLAQFIVEKAQLVIRFSEWREDAIREITIDAGEQWLEIRHRRITEFLQFGSKPSEHAIHVLEYVPWLGICIAKIHVGKFRVVRAELGLIDALGCEHAE